MTVYNAIAFYTVPIILSLLLRINRINFYEDFKTKIKSAILIRSRSVLMPSFIFFDSSVIYLKLKENCELFYFFDVFFNKFFIPIFKIIIIC